MTKFLGINVQINYDRKQNIKKLSMDLKKDFQFEKEFDEKLLVIYEDYLNNKNGSTIFNEMGYFSYINSLIDQLNWTLFSFYIRDAYMNFRLMVKDYHNYCDSPRLSIE